MSQLLYNGGKKSGRSRNQHPNCDSAWKQGISRTLSVTKLGNTIMGCCHCCSVIIVIAVPADSHGKLKMRSVLSVKWWASTSLAKKRITLTNCLLPQAWLGNLYHSRQFVSFFFCNWFQYAKRTWGKTLYQSCPAALRYPMLYVSLVCVLLWGLSNNTDATQSTANNTLILLTIAHLPVSITQPSYAV